MIEMRRAIFPGSFDPFTIGHYDIVMRGLNLFDEIIIGVGKNYNKREAFPLEERLSAITEAFHKEPRVKVMAYDGLTVDFAAAHQAQFILRGVRSTLDFEYERTLAQTNRRLYPDITTILLFTPAEYADVSSSTVRELLAFEREVDWLLPEGVDLKEYF